MFGSGLQAQVPGIMNYQAVARDASGAFLANRLIKVRITIRNGSPAGTAEFMEIRSLSTNAYGLFTTQMGSSGALFSSGKIQDVKWASGNKYMQVEIDPNNGNNYIDLGATQLLSVPYALHSLTSGAALVSADNGVSVNAGKVQIGNQAGDNIAELSEDRDLPLNRFKFSITSGNKSTVFQNGRMVIQQDSLQNGGPFMTVLPIQQHPGQVPFNFTRASFVQKGHSDMNNETFNWGFNMNEGGNLMQMGKPGIGYSIESGYVPDAGSRRWVESHEFYLRPNNEQIRLKSYTIRTNEVDPTDDDIDFYHTTDRLSVKSPLGHRLTYFGIGHDRATAATSLQLGTINNSFTIHISDAEPEMIQMGGKLDASEVMMSSFRSVSLPAVRSFSVAGNSYNYFSGHLRMNVDAIQDIGDYTIRVNKLYTKGINSNSGFFGDVVGWGRKDPNATVQIVSQSDVASSDVLLVQNIGYKSILSVKNNGAMAWSNPTGTRGIFFNADNSSGSGRVLEIKSTNSGILLPSFTSVQRDGIVTPKDGELIYNNDVQNFSGSKGVFEYYQASTNKWVKINEGSGNLANSNLRFTADRAHQGSSKNLSFVDFGKILFAQSDLHFTSSHNIIAQATDRVEMNGGRIVEIKSLEQIGMAAVTGITLSAANGKYIFKNIPTVNAEANLTDAKIDKSGAIVKTEGFYKNIHAVDAAANYQVVNNDYTLILRTLSQTRTVLLPDPKTCTGRILVLWNGNRTNSISWMSNYDIYISPSTATKTLVNGQNWQIQSDGYYWIKIN